MYKLNEVYITWKNGGVEILSKFDGLPTDVDNFIDPSLWDQSNLSLLLFEWYSMLVIGQYGVKPLKSPMDVYESICWEIEEFAGLTRGWRRLGPDDADSYEGDYQTVFQEDPPARGRRKSRQSRAEAATVD